MILPLLGLVPVMMFQFLDFDHEAGRITVGQGVGTRISRQAITCPMGSKEDKERRRIRGRAYARKPGSQPPEEPGEPYHAGTAPYRSLWWSWTAPVTGRIAVSAEGYAFPARVAVYTGDQLDAVGRIRGSEQSHPRNYFPRPGWD